MLGRFNEFFKRRFSLFKIRFGYGLFLSSAFFMLIHLVQEISIIRILTFFPGILFGMLREKYGSIFPSTIFHATSNFFAILIVPK